jgi:hypothetical protein
MHMHVEVPILGQATTYYQCILSVANYCTAVWLGYCKWFGFWSLHLDFSDSTGSFYRIHWSRSDSTFFFFSRLCLPNSKLEDKSTVWKQNSKSSVVMQVGMQLLGIFVDGAEVYSFPTKSPNQCSFVCWFKPFSVFAIMYLVPLIYWFFENISKFSRNWSLFW